MGAWPGNIWYCTQRVAMKSPQTPFREAVVQRLRVEKSMFLHQMMATSTHLVVTWK